jgi:large subunit ribosomal protein L3
LDILGDVKIVTLIGRSKGKGFQWVVRRFGFAGGPATHGSQFHRHPGGIGNRKPRRVNKWHPLPGHMWRIKVTLHNVSVVDKVKLDNEELVIVKGSVPGA